MHWALNSSMQLNNISTTLIASISASAITRTASRIAFAKHGIGTTSPDMIEAMGSALDSLLLSEKSKTTNAL